jgi:L-xylulokinase
MTSRYCVPGYFLILEGSATSASNLEWFMAQLLPGVSPQSQPQGPSIYDAVNASVADVPPDDAGLLFLPFLYGSNVGAGATACLVGLSQRHHRGHVLRAVYEGVVFSHMTHFQRLMKVRSRPSAIRATGGAARSAVWLQILADTFQLPIEVPAGSELGAQGAALSAGVAIGCYRDFADACRTAVRWGRRFDPDARQAAVYQAKYARYCRLLEALEGAWGDLAW